MIDDSNFQRFTLRIWNTPLPAVWIDSSIEHNLPETAVWVNLLDYVSGRKTVDPTNLYIVPYLYDARRLYLLGRMNNDKPMLKLFSEVDFTIAWEQAYLNCGGCLLVRDIDRPNTVVDSEWEYVSDFEVCVLTDAFEVPLTLI